MGHHPSSTQIDTNLLTDCGRLDGAAPLLEDELLVKHDIIQVKVYLYTSFKAL